MQHRIGPFEVLRELGRGGMGVVYLANDTRLDRLVAIKALPSELASDPSRLERFEREARILAGLHHPNIAGIYGVEEQDAARYLVLEFVEGESLAERLDRGPIPVDEALELAVQIAAGVEAAHDAGVIHRDLKPGNIVITAEGNAKVLDFGLARADAGSQSSSGSTDTRTMTISQPPHSPTIEGAILGTAAYMSPEQARGRRVDKRTDIWSFGVLLYEMLVGASPFHGETASDSIGAVLHKSFDLAQLPPNTPANVHRVLERCLKRDKNLRYRDIGDAQLDLLDRPDAAGEHQQQRSSRAQLIIPAIVTLIAIAAVVVVVLIGRSSVVESRPIALSIPLPDGLEQRGPIAISPDGSTVAIVAADQVGRSAVYVRNLDDFSFRMVPGSEAGRHPFFSPDSQSVGFFARDGLYRSLLTGDRTTQIVKCSSNVGATWTDDDVIVYSNGLGSPLLRVTANGRVLEPLTSLAEPELAFGHVWPQQIPGTPYLLFTTWGADGTDEAGIRQVGGARILDTRDGSFRPVSEVATRAFASPVRWSPSGHAIFEDFDNGILVLPFDPSSGTRLAFNEASPLIPGIAHYGRLCRSFFDIATDGTIAYVPDPNREATLVWVDPDGSVEEILPESVISPISNSFGRIKLSSDGARLLFGAGDIGVIDLGRRIARNILGSEGNDTTADWGPDEKSVVFASSRGGRFGLWTVDIDAMVEPVLLLGTENNLGAPAYAGNGALTYSEDLPDGDENVWLLSTDGETTPIASSRFTEDHPDITDDGRYIAFESNATGQDEIFVVEVGSSAPPVQITQIGGDSPRWSGDGRTLYFRRGRSVWSIPILDGRPAGEAQRAFPAERLGLGNSYDILPDGSRMIAVQLSEEGLAREVRIRTRFFDTIRAVADKR